MWHVKCFSEYVAKAFENTKNTFPYNATGHPALTINAGYSIDEPNLPIGMMLVGRHFDEVTVLRLAHAFERLRDSSPDYTVTMDKVTSEFQSMKMQ
jgi:amidase